MRISSLGFTIWDENVDKFNHDELAANWDLADQLLSTPPTIELTATVPVSDNFAGRTVMLTASVSGFVQWTVLRFDGSAWRAVGPLETMGALPSSHNYNGRIIMLTASTSGFSALDLVKYDSGTWELVGRWAIANTGNGAANIKGVSIGQDVYITSGARGVVLKDRSTNVLRRIYFDNGDLYSEVVT